MKKKRLLISQLKHKFSWFFFVVVRGTVKVSGFGRDSAVQPYLTLTSPCHWATSGNWRSGLPGETISRPFCVQPTYGAQEYQTQITNSYLGRVEPRRFICCAQKNSR